MFGKRKPPAKKPGKEFVIPQTGGKTISAREKAYLDQLERMIVSPGKNPYIQRGPTHQPRGADSVEPVFDSGPLKAEEVDGPKFAGPAAARNPSRGVASLATEDGHIRLGVDGIYEIEIEVPKSDLPPEDEDRPESRVRAAEMRPTPEPKLRQKPAKPKPQPQAPRQEPSFETVSQSEMPSESPALFPDGTLFMWDGNQLGIYRQHLAEKGYDLIYTVEDDGRLQPKGVCLRPYEPSRVGLLSQGILQWMESTMRWDREALIYHLENPGEASRIPVLSRPQPRPQTNGANGGANHNGENGRWVRGRTFTIHVGKHKWHGVYWGKNTLGAVVAHNTNHVWNLMHMDLKRYGTGVEFGDLLPESEIQKIEAAVSEPA